MADLTQENRQIELITPLGKDKLLLTGASINERISGLFRLDLDMVCEDENLDFETILGKQVTVKLVLPEEKVRFFNGVVGQFKTNGISEGLPCYTAQVYPWLWLLTHTWDCRIFQNKTVPDIIEQVFSDLDFDDVEFRLTADYKEWEYCVQYRESDFNFVSRLMEHEGIFYYFIHEEDLHTLVLADSNAALEAYEGFDTISFNPQDSSGGSIVQESIRTLEMEKQIHPGSCTQRDYDFKVPEKDLTTLHSIERPHDRSTYEVYDYPGHYIETTYGDAYTKIRMEALRTGYETLFCESDARGIASGHYFDLTGHSQERYNKRYLITSADYHLSTTLGFQSGGSPEGLGYHVVFQAIDFDTAYKPAMETIKPVVEGPQTAIVSGPRADEIYTDEYGRVKVQFHWDREGLRDENTSCWIRVSQVWAGKKWGAMYIPRTGQEVIVDFLEGDPDQPIITGRVYNGKSMPPYPLPEHKTVSTIKSRSSKGGGGFNELRFEDKKGKEQVFIHGQRNLDIRVKNNRYETIGGNRHLVVGNDKYEHIKKDRHEIVDENHMERIGMDHQLTVEGNRKTRVKGNQSLEVDGNHGEKVSGNHAEDVVGDFSLKAGNKIVLDAGNNITLSVGSSFIAIENGGIKLSTPGNMVIEVSGNLQISATNTQIDTRAALQSTSTTTTVDGSVMVTIRGGLVKIN